VGAPSNGQRNARAIAEAEAAVAAEGASIAEVIGQTVALHVTKALGELLQRMDWQPNCLFCVLAAKKTVHDYQVAVANAAAAGEPVPAQPPAPSVGRAITWVNIGELLPNPAGAPVPALATIPACWDHVNVPSAPPRQTGLVASDGRPILFPGQ
jgi:hypothetical protein